MEEERSQGADAAVDRPCATMADELNWQASIHCVLHMCLSVCV